MASSRTPFTAALVRAREAVDLTQEQVAAWIGVSGVTYRRWENGQGEPGASQVVTLAIALGTTPGDLLAGIPPAAGAGLLQRLLDLEAEVAALRQRLDGDG
ncbi:helix-turn-helix domain-containing protein [Patulibacter defluvii]|uniref:helix-turn-helix domain-containing protein n=1 Tax=Patulibacter defluvii TaxID=3095358 RepID=UPI002A74ECC3|nr:helix-turn-helix transcriptional regulator [Patulibacter sp. DM4]